MLIRRASQRRSAAPGVAPSNTVAPVVSGTATDGQVLTATTGTWVGDPVITYSYQWKRGATNVGTNAATYTLVAGDVGANMTCVVTGANGTGNASATSNSVGPVAAIAPSNTVAPVVFGSTVEGQTLTTTNGTWVGSAPITYSYQWKRGVTNVGTNATTYTLVAGDIGANITCVVTGTNAGGSATGTSNSVGPVTAIPVAPSNTVAPAVSGSTVEGQTLTTTTGTWVGDPVITYSYQWKRGATNVGMDANTYTLVAGDVGENITCVVTGTNGTGNASATSNSVGPITAVPVAPSNTVAPAVSGSTVEGQTLTTTTGTWTGTAPITYSYQWKRGVTNVGTNAATYVLVAGDIAANMTCVVTGTNAGGSATGTSNSVGPITAAPVSPSNTVAPVVSGTATDGQVLTTTTGTWVGDPVIVYSYQWKRGVTNVGTDATTYTLVAADVGANMTCVVTGTNGGGSANATSNSVGPVASVAPSNTVAPVVSGSTAEGQVLTATTGTWVGTAPITYSYQWKRGVTNVGTNAATYTLVAGDVGANMTCEVTGTNVGGSATGTSNSVGPVTATIYAWNPADKSANITLSNSDRTIAGSSSADPGVRSITSHSTGKYHFEVTLGAHDGVFPGFGVANASQSLAGYMGNAGNNSIAVYPVGGGGIIYRNAVSAGTIGANTTGTFAVEVDCDARTIYFQRAGGSRNGPYSITATGALYAAASARTSTGHTTNFGQVAFAITPTAGFEAPWG